MNLPDRLNAAADRLEALDGEATPGPWQSQEGSVAIHSQTGWRASCDTVQDSQLIVTLRPLAPVIVKHLRAEADRFHTDTRREAHYPLWHNEDAPGCGRDIEPVDGSPLCTCWDAAKALADTILGATS